jgi:hypothetical protein
LLELPKDARARGATSAGQARSSGQWTATLSGAIEATMKRDRVSSASIASVGYDEAQHVLELEFHNGKVYRYLHVPAAVHRLLLQAPSIGEFVNTVVKPKFEVIRAD